MASRTALFAAEGERKIADPAAGMHAGQPLANQAGSLDVGAGVVVVFFDPGGHGENIEVEDDVFGREAGLIHQQVVAALGHCDALFDALRLPLLVEGHDNHGCAQAPDFAGLLDELRLAVLEADGIGHALALHALQPGDQHLETRRVDHHRNPRNIGFRGQQVQEAAHRGLGVQQPLVHVHVQQVGAGLRLLARDAHGGRVVVRLDEPAEDRRTGHVGALAHMHEAGAFVDIQRLQSGQAGDARRLGRRARIEALQRLAHDSDVLRRGAATAAGQIQQPLLSHCFERCRHFSGRLGVFAKFVGKPGIRVNAYGQFGDPRQFPDVRMQLRCAQCAVQADGGDRRMAQGVVEGLHGLARQRAAGGVGDRAGHDYRQRASQAVAHPRDGVERRLGVERVEDGFYQQQVGAAFQQCMRGDLVGGRQLIKVNCAKAGVLHARRKRGGSIGGSQAAGHEVRPPVAALGLVGHLARDPRRGAVDLRHPALKAVVRLRRRIGGKAVCGQDVGAGPHIRIVNFAHEVRLGQTQEVMIALQRLRPAGELRAPVFFLGQFQRLGQRAHGAVNENNALADQFAQGLRPGGGTVHDCAPGALDPSASQMAAVRGARFMV